MAVGRVGRFPSASHLAAYAGLAPRVFSSGGHTRHGRTGKECNQFLKWAFVEAAEVIVVRAAVGAGERQPEGAAADAGDDPAVPQHGAAVVKRSWMVSGAPGDAAFLGYASVGLKNLLARASLS